MINRELFKEEFDKKNKYEILNDYACYANERSYLNIDKYYNISFKEYNPLIILFTFEDDKDKLYNFLNKYIDKKNKIKIKKINRKSNIDIDKLKNNLFKTLLSGNFEHAISFAKEIYLRDKFLFFKILYTFSFIGELKHFKFLFVYSLERILEVNYYENIFFAVIYYLVKKRDNIHDKNLKDIDISGISEFNRKLLNTILNIIDKYEIKNDKLLSKISYELSTDFKVDDELKYTLEKYL